MAGIARRHAIAEAPRRCQLTARSSGGKWVVVRVKAPVEACSLAAAPPSPLVLSCLLLLLVSLMGVWGSFLLALFVPAVVRCRWLGAACKSACVRAAKELADCVLWLLFASTSASVIWCGSNSYGAILNRSLGPQLIGFTWRGSTQRIGDPIGAIWVQISLLCCLLYTSDAADE